MMRGFIAVLSIICMLCSAQSAKADKRVALVFGNGAYKNIPTLPNPPMDAKAMADLLRGIGFDVVEGTNLTRDKMVELELEFGNKAQGADIAIFFYAGHGIALGGTNYLLPVDADIKSETDIKLGAGINVDIMLDQVMSDAKVKLVFLDACRDNPFAARIMAHNHTRGTSIPSGLAEMRSGEGTLIAFATGPGQTALDGAQGSHSPFTQALLTHLAEPQKDIQMVMTEVRAQVSEDTNRGQLPWGNTNLIGTVFLNPTAAAPVSTSADNTADISPAELEFWRSVKNSNNPAELEAYLTSYPDGQFKSLAQRRISSLEGNRSTTTRGPATGVVDPATYQKQADKASEDQLALSKSRRRDVQRRLTDLGFDTRENGKFDDSTRATIKRWQAARGYPATGFLNKLQQQALEKEGSSQPVDDKAARPDQGKDDNAATQQPSEPALTAKPEPDLPDFPSWPPPMPSASYVLPDKLLERYHTLKEATDAILTALESTGYVERSFFRTEPGGIALVTRLERIEADGSPAHPGRWASAESAYPSAQDLINFLRGLFFVKKGHYRLIIFVIQETPFVLSQKSMPEPEARALIGKGANTLPMATAKRSFEDNHCTALIYEFSSDGKSVEFLAESPLTGKQHLDKAGVLSLLAKPR